jgi:hypothetical protein
MLYPINNLKKKFSIFFGVNFIRIFMADKTGLAPTFCPLFEQSLTQNEILCSDSMDAVREKLNKLDFPPLSIYYRKSLV